MEACRRAGYGAELAEIMTTVENTPYDPAHHFERLKGNLKGYCSRQINHGNRFLYTVHPNTENATDRHGKPYEGIVRVHRSWKHIYIKP